MVGARIPAGTDGVDLSPVIEGRALAGRPDLYWAYGKEGAAKETPQPALERDQAPPFAIREGDWKLLAEAGGASPQLFNLARDPLEANDVAASQPAVRRRLRQAERREGEGCCSASRFGRVPDDSNKKTLKQ